MLRRRTGDIDELLVYRDGRSWRRVTSSDINTYLKEVVALDVSAKDFRTWHGTVLAAVAVAEEFIAHPAGRPWNNRAMDAAVRRSVAAVAANLGNTPAVCRGSYINPRVLDLFRQGTTIDRAVARARRSLPARTTGGKQQADPEVIAAIGGTRSPNARYCDFSPIDHRNADRRKPGGRRHRIPRPAKRAVPAAHLMQVRPAQCQLR